MRSTGGLVPVGVRTSVWNQPNVSVTWSSRAVYGPHMSQKLEHLWVIPRHAVRARKILRRILDPYGRSRARSWKLSLHNFYTRAFYEFGTIEARRQSYGSHTGQYRHMSHVRALKNPGWVLTVPYGSALKTTVHGSCGWRTGSVRCLEILTVPARAVTTHYGRFPYGCSQAVRHLQGPVRCPHDPKKKQQR